MKKLIVLFVLLLLVSGFCISSFSQEDVKKQNSKINKQAVEEKVKSIADKVDWSSEEVELVTVNVQNEFSGEVRVKLDTSREYTIGPNESQAIGKRTPGKYTLTIYNKNGEFVDTLTNNINKATKFVLNKDTLPNVNVEKITGVSISETTTPADLLQNQAIQSTPTPLATPVEEVGKNLKFLNTRFSQLKLIVEDANGKPLENNWIFPRASGFDKALPLISNGEKITINPGQRIIARTSNGLELQRYWFELDIDPADRNYVWIVK